MPAQAARFAVARPGGHQEHRQVLVAVAMPGVGEQLEFGRAEVLGEVAWTLGGLMCSFVAGLKPICLLRTASAIALRRMACI